MKFSLLYFDLFSTYTSWKLIDELIVYLLLYVANVSVVIIVAGNMMLLFCVLDRYFL